LKKKIHVKWVKTLDEVSSFYDRYIQSDLDLSDSNLLKADSTVVIPVLNEEEAIEKVIDSVRKAGYVNILVVDGHSTDNTVEKALEKDVDLVVQKGTGKTGAINTAIEEVSTPFFVLIDGDCTYDPEDIESLLYHIKEHEQVIGARILSIENISLVNRFGNFVINNTFNLIFGTTLTDVCSGMYALRTEFAKKMNLVTKGFDVEVEVAAHSANGGRITETPISYNSRIGEKKLSPLRDGLKIILTVWNLARLYNPVLLFSIFGSILMIMGLAVLDYVSIEWLDGVWHDGLALLGVTAVIISFLIFTISIISLLLKKMEKRIFRKLNT
jgi:dolichol-phosphate mannosyltransferase